MIKFIQDRPWIWVIVAFTILITGWIFLLRLANERRPDSVEVYQPLSKEKNVDQP